MKLFPTGIYRSNFAAADPVYHKKYGFGTHQPLATGRAHISKKLMRVLFERDGKIHWVKASETCGYKLSLLDYIKDLFGWLQ